MKNTAIIITITFFMLPLFASGSTTVSDVEKHLMCTCGCSMALYTCECSRASEMRNEISSMIDQGQSKEQIIEAYVAQFGEKILSAPTKEGFNLLAWVMPFFALLVVGGVLYKGLHRWSRAEKEPASNMSTQNKEKYNQRLAEELKDFQEGEIT